MVSLKANVIFIMSMVQLLAARVSEVSVPSSGKFSIVFGHEVVSHGHGILVPITSWDSEKYCYSFSEILPHFSIFSGGEKKSQNALVEGVIYFV